MINKIYTDENACKIHTSVSRRARLITNKPICVQFFWTSCYIFSKQYKRKYFHVYILSVDTRYLRGIANKTLLYNKITNFTTRILLKKKKKKQPSLNFKHVFNTKLLPIKYRKKTIVGFHKFLQTYYIPSSAITAVEVGTIIRPVLFTAHFTAV